MGTLKNFVLPHPIDIAFANRVDLNYAILAWHGGYTKTTKRLQYTKLNILREHDNPINYVSPAVKQKRLEREARKMLAAEHESRKPRMGRPRATFQDMLM